MAKEFIPKNDLEQVLIKEAAHLMHHYKRYLSVSDVVEELIGFVRRFPAADVIEVRHGRWICINKRYGEYECSVCHGVDSNCSDYYGIHAVTEQEFCPNCGAKMDKEEADELD